MKSSIDNLVKVKQEIKPERQLTFKNYSYANKFAKELLKNCVNTNIVILTSKYSRYATNVIGGKQVVLTFQYWDYDFDKVNFEKLLKKYQDHIIW